MTPTVAFVTSALLAPAVHPRDIDPAASEPKLVGAAAAAPSVSRPRPAATTPPAPRPHSAAPPHTATAPAKPTPSPSGQAAHAQGDTPAAGFDPSAPCLRARGRCRPAMIAGIALSSIGAAVLGTGVGFQFVPDYADTSSPIHDRSLGPPGVVLVAVGATTLATGVAAIVSGQVMHRRERRAALSSAVRLTPGGLRF